MTNTHIITRTNTPINTYKYPYKYMHIYPYKYPRHTPIVSEALCCDLDAWNQPKVNTLTMMTSAVGVFAGGDIAGIANTSVEATNDGKLAASRMHVYLQVRLLYGLPGQGYLITYLWVI